MWKRGQAMIELLATYGWMALLLFAAIGVLYALGLFSPQGNVPESCLFPPGFSCTDFDLDSNGNLYLALGQATGKDVQVTGIGCGSNESPEIIPLPVNVTIKNGRQKVISAGGIRCAGGDGSMLRGKIVVEYKNFGSVVARTTTAELNGKLENTTSGWVAGAGSTDYRYGYYRALTINTGVASNLTDFPAYFIMDTQSLISAGKMNSSCKDLRVVPFTLAGNLDYEIENGTCNTTGTVVWFRIPQTNGNNSYTAYVYYGNSSAADGQNRPGVWSNGYTAVYHFGNDTLDSTGSNAGTLSGGTNQSGLIGTGLRVDGVDDYFQTTTSGFSNLSGTVSLRLSSSWSPGDNKVHYIYENTVYKSFDNFESSESVSRWSWNTAAHTTHNDEITAAAAHSGTYGYHVNFSANGTNAYDYYKRTLTGVMENGTYLDGWGMLPYSCSWSKCLGYSIIRYGGNGTHQGNGCIGATPAVGTWTRMVKSEIYTNAYNSYINTYKMIPTHIDYDGWYIGTNGINAWNNCSIFADDMRWTQDGVELYRDTDSNLYAIVGGTKISASPTWAAARHIAFAYQNGSNATVYLNGATLVTATNISFPYPIGSTASIGNAIQGTNIYSGNALFDELRVSSVSRSADWVKAEYVQAYSVGAEQAN